MPGCYMRAFACALVGLSLPLPIVGPAGDNKQYGSKYASAQTAGDAPFGDATGVATVKNPMTKNAPLTETTSAAAAAMSSKPNAHFLRRGTRTILELIHIERLTGRRGPDDWMVAGTGPWLERREQMEREAAELKELLSISMTCKTLPNLKVWDAAQGCELFCGRAWPCATCKDGIKNGDEVGTDCGGSCIPCITCVDGIKNGDEEGIDCGGSCEDCSEQNREEEDWIRLGLEGPPEPEPEGTESAAIYKRWGNSHFQTGAYERGDYHAGAPYFPWVDSSSAYDPVHWYEIYGLNYKDEKWAQDLGDAYGGNAFNRSGVLAEHILSGRRRRRQLEEAGGLSQLVPQLRDQLERHYTYAHSSARRRDLAVEGYVEPSMYA